LGGLSPHEQPGTLAWWDGEQFVAVALWAWDHREYVIGDWSGSAPPGALLAVGIGDPRASGWRQAPDGQWHEAPPVSQSPGTGLSGCVLVVVVIAALALLVFGFGVLWWLWLWFAIGGLSNSNGVM
jgi:hypothetical protein